MDGAVHGTNPRGSVGPDRRAARGAPGSRLTTYLLEQGEWVVEIDRPARRYAAKSDELDAVRAVRGALSREHLAQPRRRGDREAIRVLVCTREGAILSRTRAMTHLHTPVVNAPEGIRNQLRKLSTDDLLERCARLRTGPSRSIEHRSTIAALPATDRRALSCEAEAADLESACSSSLASLPNCSPSPVRPDPPAHRRRGRLHPVRPGGRGPFPRPHQFQVRAPLPDRQLEQDVQCLGRDLRRPGGRRGDGRSARSPR